MYLFRSIRCSEYIGLYPCVLHASVVVYGICRVLFLGNRNVVGTYFVYAAYLGYSVFAALKILIFFPCFLLFYFIYPFVLLFGVEDVQVVFIVFVMHLGNAFTFFLLSCAVDALAKSKNDVMEALGDHLVLLLFVMESKLFLLIFLCSTTS